MTDEPGLLLMRAWRTTGKHVHVVTVGRWGKRTSLCPLGPNYITDSDVFTGDYSDVTCPNCLKRVRDAS